MFVVSGDGSDTSFVTVRSAMRFEIVPDLIGAAFAIALIVRQGWAHLVPHETLRTCTASSATHPRSRIEHQRLGSGALSSACPLAVVPV